MTGIEHDSSTGRFYLDEDGHRAELNYRREGEVMAIVRTHVPGEIGGRGLAGKLTQAALQWARDEGLKVDPVCSYVDSWMNRHPEYQSLRALS